MNTKPKIKRTDYIMLNYSTKNTVEAFMKRQPHYEREMSTDGDKYYFHGEPIAEYRNKCIWISNAGWKNNHTLKRLRAIPGVYIKTYGKRWYFNCTLWDGGWASIIGKSTHRKTNRFDYENTDNSVFSSKDALLVKQIERKIKNIQVPVRRVTKGDEIFLIIPPMYMDKIKKLIK